ncbi:MAG: AAA family ATPase [Candidatus Altiarchaeota archaeon]
MTFVVGLAGRIASGKGEVSRHLAEKHRASIFRFSDILRDVLEVLGLSNTRENLQELGAGLRASFGENVLTEAMKARIGKSTSKLVIVDGIRYKKEAELVRSFKENIIIFVDAPLKQRYKRAVKRGTRGEAGMTLEKFRESEEKDTEKNLDEIKALADEVIENTSSVEKLREKVDLILTAK